MGVCHADVGTGHGQQGGLLRSGRRACSNQAFYTEEHLTSLKRIGAMGGLARPSLAEIRAVLAVLDGSGSVFDSMPVIQNVLAGRRPPGSRGPP